MAPLDHSFDWTSTTKEAFMLTLLVAEKASGQRLRQRLAQFAGLQVVEAPRMGRGRESGAPPDGQI